MVKFSWRKIEVDLDFELHLIDILDTKIVELRNRVEKNLEMSADRVKTLGRKRNSKMASFSFEAEFCFRDFS